MTNFNQGKSCDIIFRVNNDTDTDIKKNLEMSLSIFELKQLLAWDYPSFGKKIDQVHLLYKGIDLKDQNVISDYVLFVD